MRVKSESEATQSVGLLATPWTVAYQAPPTMGFSRQEYWSGVPLPSPHTMKKRSKRHVYISEGSRQISETPQMGSLGEDGYMHMRD